VTPVISVVGRSNAGKTTLLEKVIRELTARGRRVGTVKHHVHGPVEVDVPGKDSWRHRRAGAVAVAVVSRQTFFVVRDTPEDESLEAIVHRAMAGVDLVLTEGFKSGPMPKIEVSRAAQQVPLLCGPDDHLIAVVTDRGLDVPVPCFGLDDVGGLADFIEREFLREPSASPVEVLVDSRRLSLEPEAQAVLARVVRSLVGDPANLRGGSPIEIRIPGSPA
jgi:molybdopterin-guanine dinucleotide biosynthesis protein B